MHCWAPTPLNQISVALRAALRVHCYINELGSSFGTYLYGPRMYETMVYWETAHTVPDQPQFVLDFARQWQSADKIVYSRSLAEPRNARTRIERDFNART
jgi:hypothetical protein